MFIIVIFSIFFAIIGVAYFIAYQSHRDPNIVGALVLMWIVVALFLLTVYFGGKNRQSTNQPKTGFAPNHPITFS